MPIAPNGVANLTVARLPTEILVAVAGYRVTQTQLAGDTTVTLQPPLRVRVSTAAADRVPAGKQLQIWLVPQDRVARRWARVGPVIFVDGIADLPVGWPGLYLVSLMLAEAGERRGRARVLEFTPRTLEISDTSAVQEFALAIPPTAIEKARR